MSLCLSVVPHLTDCLMSILRFTARLCMLVLSRDWHKCVVWSKHFTMQEGRKGSKEAMGGRTGHAQPGASSYEAISATLGWETFRLVHSTWLTAIDLPSRDENKWEMQV